MTDLPVGLPEWPAAYLPEDLGAYAAQVAESLGAPRDFAAAALTTVLAAAVGTGRAIEVTSDWVELPVLWTALVAAPGTTKSTLMRRVAQPLWKRAARYAQAYREVMLQYEEDLAEWERQRRKGDETLPPRPRPPTQRVVAVSSTTTEALTRCLVEDQHGVLAYQDEIGAWIGEWNAYKPQGGADRQWWLSAWASAPIARLRSGQPVALVRRPAVSVLTAGVPVGLGALAPRSGVPDDGLFSRLLWVYPRLPAVRRPAAAVDPGLERVVAAVVDRLLDLPVATDGEGQVVPARVGMDQAGEAAWWEEWARNAELLNTMHEEDPLRATVARLPALAARLALVRCLAVATWAGREEEPRVEAPDVRLAWEVARCAAAHARRVWLRATASQEDVALTRTLDWMRLHGGTATPRLLVHAGLASRTSEARALLDAAQDAGLGRWQRVQGQRGRPSDVFTLFGVGGGDDGDGDE